MCCLWSSHPSQQVASAAAATLADVTSGDPADSDVLVVFVLGGLSLSEVAACQDRVDAVATAAAAAAGRRRRQKERERAAAGGDEEDDESDDEEEPERTLPQVILGGSCLATPEALFDCLVLGND